jgi:hypothetical protein
VKLSTPAYKKEIRHPWKNNTHIEENPGENSEIIKKNFDGTNLGRNKILHDAYIITDEATQ